MARRSSRARFDRARSERIPVWFQWRLNLAVATAGSSTLLTVLNAAALALRPFTIIRTRLLLFVESDQSIASEIAQGAFGMIVVQEEAVDAGVISLPTPISEADASFFVYEPFVNSFVFGDATGFVEPAGTLMSIDSKAMRKVGLSEDVASIVELGSAEGVNIAFEGRMLVKLH